MEINGARYGFSRGDEGIRARILGEGCFVAVGFVGGFFRRNRKSSRISNASRMPFGHALSSRLKPLDNRSPIHPSHTPLIAGLGRAAK